MCLACDLPEILEPAQATDTDRAPVELVADQNAANLIVATKLAADASCEHVTPILHL